MRASSKCGANALFALGLPAGSAANDNSVPGVRITTELGYGFGALGGTAVQVPWAGWSLAESGGQTMVLGWRLRFGRGGASGSFGVEASRHESVNDNTPLEHAIGFRLNARF